MFRYNARTATAVLTLFATCLVSWGVAATTFDEYVQHLREDNEVLRSLARQWLPREGVKAVRPVLPLIFHENPAVSWAAINVIQDIENDVSFPGKEAERAEVAAALLAALAATQNQDQQFTLLRMLPIVVPEGADVSAIAELLQQPETRERARRALQEINTVEARAALRAALPTADPAFSPALMDALARTGDTEAFPLLRDKLEGGTDAEKAAAALALAASADPELVGPYLTLCAQIDINHRPDAEDAALRLGQALCVAGGRWEAGMALYRGLLNQSQSPMVRGGALAGLGRYGDETAFDTIMAAWAADDSGLLEAPAMAAIESLQDPGVADKLLAAYAGQPVPVQERLLGIMGRKHDARYLPAFESAAAINPAVRLDALQQSGLAEAVPLIETLGAAGDPAVKDQATGAISTMAAAYRDAGDRAGAGRAYLALYRLAGDESTKAAALEGIKSFPVPEAYDTLKAALGEQGLMDLPTPILAGMARVLAEAGRHEESGGMRTALLARATDTATVQQLIQLGPVQGSHEDLARSLGFIVNWHVAGAFPQKDAPADGTPVLKNGAVELAATWTQDGETVKWEAKQGGGGMAIVDLTYFGRDHVRIFAYSVVSVASEQDAVLRLGTDDGVRAWVNGATVHENIVDRGTALDSDLVPVKLKAGENAILLEILQNAGGTNYCARLTQPDGLPLVFEQK
jgi:HEAT repeat protein